MNGWALGANYQREKKTRNDTLNRNELVSIGRINEFKIAAINCYWNKTLDCAFGLNLPYVMTMVNLYMTYQMMEYLPL